MLRFKINIDRRHNILIKYFSLLYLIVILAFLHHSIQYTYNSTIRIELSLYE